MANNITASEYTRTYTSFSGCDILASFQGKVIGELQAITYSVSREKAPIYTMGSAEPRSFSRGKRGVAGRLVFTVFDRDAMIEELKEHSKNSNFSRIGGASIENQAMTIDEWDKAMSSIVSSGGTNESTDADASSDLLSDNASGATPYYADEIAPFDITISFQNEYGQRAVLVVYGVEILNEGSGYSIDSVASEKEYTFVARRIDYLKNPDNLDNDLE